MFFQLWQKPLRETCEREQVLRREISILTLIAGSPSFRCRKVGICMGKFCDVPML
jgi:hypothetical protein